MRREAVEEEPGKMKRDKKRRRKRIRGKII